MSNSTVKLSTIRSSKCLREVSFTEVNYEIVSLILDP